MIDKYFGNFDFCGLRFEDGDIEHSLKENTIKIQMSKSEATTKNKACSKQYYDLAHYIYNNSSSIFEIDFDNKHFELKYLNTKVGTDLSTDPKYCIYTIDGIEQPQLWVEDEYAVVNFVAVFSIL